MLAADDTLKHVWDRFPAVPNYSQATDPRELSQELLFIRCIFPTLLGWGRERRKAVLTFICPFSCIFKVLQQISMEVSMVCIKVFIFYGVCVQDEPLLLSFNKGVSRLIVAFTMLMQRKIKGSP